MELRSVPNYPMYKASRDGRIFSFQKCKTGREMKPAPDANGYYRTMLTNTVGKYNTVKVHRIIASAFIPNPKRKPCVNHKNGIRTDNRVCNLEWCDVSENIKHSFKIGLSSNIGEGNPAATLNEADVKEIRRKYKLVNGRYQKRLADIANDYGTSRNVIKCILIGKTWKHLL